MKPRPLTADDMRVSAEHQPHWNRYRVNASLVGLSAVNCIRFIDAEDWERGQPLQRAIIGLILTKRLSDHLEAASKYVAGTAESAPLPNILHD